MKLILVAALLTLAACNDKSKPVEVVPTPETAAAAQTEAGLAAAQATPSTDQAPASCGCQKIFMPVCGADGVTYGNSCEAECNKVTWTDGDCPQKK